MAGHKKNENVLIVEDEEDIRNFCRRALEKPSISTYAASGGMEALEYIQRVKFALMLTDIKMPGLGGEELLKRTKAVSPSTDVIVMTGFPALDSTIRIFKSGACDYIVKPFDTQSLRMTVDSHLEQREQRGDIEWERSLMKKLVCSDVETSKLARENKDAISETILKLCAIAEYPSGLVGGHLLRMRDYCVIIARSLGLTEKQAELIKYASPLHDIGKIGICKSTLLKPGKLTAEEYEEVKRHPLIGAQILSGSGNEILEPARDIALVHHEKFDGTGYPRRISGEDIPVFGRIAAIADVFDALTSRRVYKPSYTIEKAVEIMGSEAGRHFDPLILKVFLGSIEKVRKTAEEFKDTRQGPSGSPGGDNGDILPDPEKKSE